MSRVLLKSLMLGVSGYLLVNCQPIWAVSRSKCDQLLTVSQVDALKNADDNRKIKVLVSNSPLDNGMNQVIVVFGETHIKGKREHKQDVQVLKNFANRALEGQTGKSHILLKTITFFNEIGFKALRLLTFGFGPYDSAIEYANKVAPQNGETINLIPLERSIGQKPLESKLANVHLGAFFACTASAICLTLASYTHPELLNYAWDLAKITVVDTAYIGISKPLMRQFSDFKDETWYKVLFHIWVGTISNRNQLIAANAFNSLNELNGDPMLLIVGDNHVNVISEILKNRGFSEVDWKK